MKNNLPKIKLKNIWPHLRKIQTHRKWVRHYCFLAGIPWRGLTHDLSKYSPIEFWESVRFYVGTSSPINEAKISNSFNVIVTIRCLLPIVFHSLLTRGRISFIKIPSSA